MLCTGNNLFSEVCTGPAQHLDGKDGIHLVEFIVFLLFSFFCTKSLKSCRLFSTGVKSAMMMIMMMIMVECAEKSVKSIDSSLHSSPTDMHVITIGDSRLQKSALASIQQRINLIGCAAEKMQDHQSRRQVQKVQQWTSRQIDTGKTNHLQKGSATSF